MRRLAAFNLGRIAPFLERYFPFCGDEYGPEIIGFWSPSVGFDPINPIRFSFAILQSELNPTDSTKVERLIRRVVGQIELIRRMTPGSVSKARGLAQLLNDELVMSIKERQELITWYLVGWHISDADYPEKMKRLFDTLHRMPDQERILVPKLTNIHSVNVYSSSTDLRIIAISQALGLVVRKEDMNSAGYRVRDELERDIIKSLDSIIDSKLPNWTKVTTVRGELHVPGAKEIVIFDLSRATKQSRILDAFQANGWTDTVISPFNHACVPGNREYDRIGTALSSLGNKTKLLRFKREGKTELRWSYKV